MKAFQPLQGRLEECPVRLENGEMVYLYWMMMMMMLVMLVMLMLEKWYVKTCVYVGTVHCFSFICFFFGGGVFVFFLNKLEQHGRKADYLNG